MLKNILYLYEICVFRDIESMSKLAGTLPLYFDAVESFQGGPLGGQTLYFANTLRKYFAFGL